MRYTRLDGERRRGEGVAKHGTKSKKGSRKAPAKLVALKKAPDATKRPLA